MSLGIKVSYDEGGSALAGRYLAALEPAKINPVIGRAAVNVFRAHLFDCNRTRPNALGGARTGFYAAAARGTSFTATAGGVIISINQVGIGQRYFGGTITPTAGKKYLTIPAAPEAYGKRAAEFPGLRVLFNAAGRPVALYQPVFAAGSGKGKGALSGPFERAQGKVLFRLVTSVTQKPDPSVLPDPAKIFAAIDEAVISTGRRQLGANA